MTSRLFYFALCAVFCSQLRAQESPFSNAGPLKVVVVDSVTLKDDTRGRTIETLVRYPSGPGSFPVIVFSHGALSNKEAFGPASEHWASHGYVVIHPNHADARSGTNTGGMRRTRFGGQQESGGTDKENPNRTNSNKQENRRGAGLVIGGLGGGANMGRIERIKDITSVLDSLDQVETQIPSLKGRLNRDAIAVAGHSFGAYVAQCHGGVKTLKHLSISKLI